MGHPKRLWPREHGAWVQLALPTLTVLLLARPAAAPPWLLTLAALAAFVAHESLLVVVGARGGRLRDARGPQALRLLVLLGGGAVIAGAIGLALAGPWVWLASLAVAAPAAALAPLVRRRREKTTPGELLAAAALAGLALPIGLAAGLPPRLAVTLWLLWAASFGVETLMVRGVLAMAKKRTPSRRLLDLAAALAVGIQVGLVGLVAAGALEAAVAWAFVPASALCVGAALRPPSARRLLAVGLAMAALGAVAMAVLLAGLSA